MHVKAVRARSPKLQTGDEVRIKIIETDRPDKTEATATDLTKRLHTRADERTEPRSGAAAGAPPCRTSGAIARSILVSRASRLPAEHTPQSYGGAIKARSAA